MSTWRKKAMECLPDYKKEFESPDTSIYLVFSAVLHSTVDAHKNNDKIQLKKNYDFAAWCFHQKQQKIYGTLPASLFMSTWEIIRPLARPCHNGETYDHIRVLLERRLDEATLREVDASFGIRKKKY